jgi:hypothetical protein
MSARTETNQLSSQQKYVKKLEKEVSSLKKEANSISLHGPQIRVLENKDIGEHVVAVIGKGGTEDANILVFHRLIGTDSSIPMEDSWCVSDAKDIPGFLETKEHPGKQKIMSNISKKKEEFAISLGLLKKEQGDQLTYPDGSVRTEILDEARDYRSLYIRSKGLKASEAPGVEFFMSPSHALAEQKYKTGLLDSQEYCLAVKPFYMELASHRPHTLTMSYQRMAPYLYGMEVSQVLGSLYLHLAGIPNPTSNKVPSFHNVIEEPFPSTDAKFADVKDLDRLKESLEEFKDAAKQLNLAESDQKRWAKVSTKDEKKTLAEEVSSARDVIATAKKHVMAADIDFGKHTKPGKKPVVGSKTETGNLTYMLVKEPDGDSANTLAEKPKTKTKGKDPVAKADPKPEDIPPA